MRLARLQHNLLLGIAAGEPVESGALGEFNAGVAAILSGNRDAMDSELLALENTLDRVFVSQQNSVPEQASDASAEHLSVPPGSLSSTDASGDGEDPVGASPASNSGDAEVDLAQPAVEPEGAAGGAEPPQEAIPPDAGVVPAPAEPSPEPLDLGADQMLNEGGLQLEQP